jgi:hypothetical protein
MLMALQQSSTSIKAKVAGIEKNQKRIADVRVLTEQVSEPLALRGHPWINLTRI